MNSINTKTLWIILVVLIVAAGGLFYFRSQSGVSTELAADPRFVYGAYPYVCDDETGFVMEPSQDTLLLRVTPTDNSAFEQVVLTDTASTDGGGRYEGGGVVFRGLGETVTLTIDGDEITCSPLPNPDEAPFNFGD